MTNPSTERVRKYHAKKRAQGYTQMSIWVPNLNTYKNRVKKYLAKMEKEYENSQDN